MRPINAQSTKSLLQQAIDDGLASRPTSLTVEQIIEEGFARNQNLCKGKGVVLVNPPR
jgi:hypothetical protein